jgi:hypothetical protein
VLNAFKRSMGSLDFGAQHQQERRRRSAQNGAHKKALIKILQLE